MKCKLGLLLLLIMPITVMAMDLSGVYTCEGDDAHEGKYSGTVTMKMRPEHSRLGYVSYDFQLTVADYGIYQGHAVAQGTHVAMHFALPSAQGLYGGATQDYGTGIAEFKHNKQGRLYFKKFYYEPLFKAGNTGIEECVRNQ